MTVVPPIFIVDDDQDDIDILTSIIRSIGVQLPILSFENAQHALAELQTPVAPALIISDINMPGKNGIAFKRELDQQPITQPENIPFVFLTTVVSTETAEIVQKEFINTPVLEKPTNLRDFKQLIMGIFQHFNLL